MDHEGRKDTKAKRARPLPFGLALIYEDRDLLVIHKPSGLLTISSEKQRERTAYFVMMDYVRKGNSKSRNRVFIVHRLDRDTSGVLVLARSEEAQYKLQSEWDNTEKTYLALVHGRPLKETDLVTSYLAENASCMVYSTKDPSKGKLSQTRYQVINSKGPLSLLQVDLLTGRKNQIRVHMRDIGHPVVGDRKYGLKSDRSKLALHALCITITHPYSGKRMTFSAKPTPVFTPMLSSLEFKLPGHSG